MQQRTANAPFYWTVKAIFEVALIP